MNQGAFFSDTLLRWYQDNKRPLPWRNTKNPYLIWLSEIILQQTRVDQGLPYYEHFVNAYPNVEALALAEEDQVMKSWEGLGYYSRARNLHTTAKEIASNGGLFPNQYEALLKLPGIGDYTASAIASFAFDRPTPVVDGNVLRLVSRFFGIEEDISKLSVRKNFKQLLQPLIEASPPAIFNNAIMEFGALQCKPKKPECSTCPLNTVCQAHLKHTVHRLPFNSKKISKKTSYLHYFLSGDSHQWIKKREASGIWGGLYDFPCHSSNDANFSPNENAIIGITPSHFSLVKSITHQLTHRTLKLKFWIADELEIENSSIYTRVSNKNLHQYPFPRAMHWIYSYF